MKSLETIQNKENPVESFNKRKLEEKEIQEFSKKFDLEKPHPSPEFYEVHKHIENLVASLSKNKQQEYKAQTLTDNGKETVADELDHLHAESEKTTTERTKKITTNIVDFIPVLGSAKMIVEGVRGKQYGTDKEISGTSRAIHTVSGAVFLGLDLTGVGSIASEIGKGALKIGERAVLKKLEQKASSEIIAKEGTKLITRGKKRIDEQEKITNQLN